MDDDPEDGMRDLHEDVENVLGQFCYAFGAGAGGMRVHRETIGVLQQRYRPYLAANLASEDGRQSWKTAKYHLLDYLSIMGKYAAALALESGDMTILPEHVEAAAQRFEVAAHRTRPRALEAGKWCPGGPSPDRPGPPQPEGELRGGARPELRP
jgi:hypothetical protein